VLLTTQYLDEADQLATDIVIVDHGRVVASGTPRELKAKVGGDVVELHVRDESSLAGAGRALYLLGTEPPRIDAATRCISVRVERGSDNLRDALRVLDGTGVELDDITLRRPTLDEVFLTLTGKESA
jgi:ABC-2 type transport system ATP-binding protein